MMDMMGKVLEDRDITDAELQRFEMILNKQRHNSLETVLKQDLASKKAKIQEMRRKRDKYDEKLKKVSEQVKTEQKEFI